MLAPLIWMKLLISHQNVEMTVETIYQKTPIILVIQTWGKKLYLNINFFLRNNLSEIIKKI